MEVVAPLARGRDSITLGLMTDFTSRAVLIVAMVASILTVDLLFLRQSQWTIERLAANIGIVLFFGASYFRFFTHR